ncbi:MAG: VanZ family protein [Pseudomonadota bacterium]
MTPNLPWSRILFGFLLALVTFLTLTPNPDDTEPGFALTRWIADLLLGNSAFADKIAHFLAYAALGATAYWAKLTVFSRRIGAAFALALYGVVLEGLQGLGGVRSPELGDALANAFGALGGIAGAVALGAGLQRLRAQ